jgi:hypothetical protein
MLVLPIGIMIYAVEMPSYGMIILTASMKIGTVVQAVLRVGLRNLKFCNIDITDGRGFMKCAVVMDICCMICILSHTAIGSGI